MDSITFPLAQLELDDSQSAGGSPISRLPNELVQSILGRLEMQALIPLQVVCKRWQAVIYSIGSTKKSLSVAKCDRSIYDFDFLKYKKRVYGQINVITFTRIKVKSFWNEYFPSQLVNLFPNIESIALDLPLSDIIDVLPRLDQLTTLSFTFDRSTPSNEYAKLLRVINSCVSLKQLDINAQIYCPMSLLAPTFARLEQFSYFSYEPSLVEHFGPSCSRVYLNIYEQDTQWHAINGQWLANVTSLDLNGVREPDRLIDYLSQHAASLQVLRIISDYSRTQMTPQMIGHLSKLKHLTELDLAHILVDLLELKQTSPKLLVPLVSIRTFTLLPCNFIGLEDCDGLTSVLCTIVPNVEHLTLWTDRKFNFEGIDKYLDRFAKLRSHSIKCVWSIHFE